MSNNCQLVPITRVFQSFKNLNIFQILSIVEWNKITVQMSGKLL